MNLIFQKSIHIISIQFIFKLKQSKEICWNIMNDIRCALSTFSPQIFKLVEDHQHHSLYQICNLTYFCNYMYVIFN